MNDEQDSARRSARTGDGYSIRDPRFNTAGQRPILTMPFKNSSPSAAVRKTAVPPLRAARGDDDLMSQEPRAPLQPEAIDKPGC